VAHAGKTMPKWEIDELLILVNDSSIGDPDHGVISLLQSTRSQ
jgi:hypothetical protein